VALSRGRQDNQIWIVDDTELDTNIEPHGRPEQARRDPVGELVRGLERSNRQQLATDTPHQPLPADHPEQQPAAHQTLPPTNARIGAVELDDDIDLGWGR
jgi:hypothetical protein